MIIAEHCRPEGWRGKTQPYTPTMPWPEKCYVQWGGSGIVFKGDQSYTTAFFEAFPHGGGFERGEGVTVEDAEKQCFLSYKKHQTCEGHTFGRRGYTNSVGVCVRCGHRQSDVFPEIYRMGAWKKPLSSTETTLLGMMRHWSGDSAESHRALRWLELRFKLFGSQTPEHLNEEF